VTSLQGKQIATIGSTGGIGSAIQSELHRAGAKAIAIGRSPEKLAGLADVSSACVVLDLAKPDAWPAAISSLPELDGLVICSGRLDVAPFRVTSPAKFSEAMDINVVAPAMFVRALLRTGKLKASCSIVFIGSIAGLRASPGNLTYAAGKSALHGVVRNMALELAPQRIRVNMVSPGLVQAGMGEAIRSSVTADQLQEYARRYPLGLGKAEQVAGPVAFLLSDQASWITGQDLVADGGATLS
jgi:NAD(P)-dependent dehydrogenase (short-subunit alcohol dehydrogenase family)